MAFTASSTASAPRGIAIPGRSAAHDSPSRDASQSSSLDQYAASPASPARKLAARTFLERDNTRPELRAPHLSPEDAESSTFSDLAPAQASSVGASQEAHHHYRRPEGEELAAEGERDEIGFAEAVRREREQRGDYSPIEGGTPGTPPLPHSPLCSSQVPLEDLEGLNGGGGDGFDAPANRRGPRSAADVAESGAQMDYLSSSPLRWVPQSSKVQTPPLCSSIKGLEPMSVVQEKQQGGQTQGQPPHSMPVRPSPLART